MSLLICYTGVGVGVGVPVTVGVGVAVVVTVGVGVGVFVGVGVGVADGVIGVIYPLPSQIYTAPFDLSTYSLLITPTVGKSLKKS